MGNLPPKKPEERKSNIHDRHFRRMLRDNAAELGRERLLREQLEARLAELENKNKGGDPAVASPEDPEPQRADFSTEAEYFRAVGKWEAKQTTKEQISKYEAELSAKRSEEQYRQRVAAMDIKAKEDIEIFDDWDEVREKASGKDFKLTQTNTVLSLFATSNVRTPVVYYLAQHPKAVERLESLKDDPAEAIQEFRRIEGRAETLYNRESKKAKADASEVKKAEPVKEVLKEEPKPPVKTSAERDAEKPQPTGAITPKGGGVPSDTPSPFLEDGVTANPTWLSWMNNKRQR